MNSIGFRIFCITIAVLFFFESAFSTAFSINSNNIALNNYSYGQLNKIEDINENEINFAFNTHGHVNWIQDQLGKETEATYDLMGRLLTVVTPLNRTYTVQYDDWGRPERLLFPQVYNEGTEQWETHDVSVEYDHGSLITLLRDELGRETTLLYDDAMRLIEVMNAEEQTMSFDYYDSGALQFFTNGRGKTTTYIYNSRWELFEIYLPDNSQDPYESFQYDEDGNLTGYQNALGQIIGYEYDDAGRLTLIDYPTGTDTSISYDDANRVTSVSDLSGTTSWTYNEAYELIALSTPQGGLEYEYDNLGRLWKLIKNTNQVTEYGYDDASRLVSVLNPYNELTEFEYDDDSKLIRKLFANGTKEEYSYDERNRLLGIVLKKSNNDVLSTHEYVYDAASNIISRTSNGVTTEFAYDLIDQLLTETKQGYSAEYTYDANGNRLTRTVNNVTEDYEYDDADKLLNVKINNTPVKEYTYDDCGRLIEVESSAGTTYLQWDIRNRLTQITYPNSSTNTFGYNGFGARISKSDSTGNYTFLRNGTGVTAPVLSDSYAEYTPGISERRSSNSKFYHSDLKNTTAQTNSDQNITGTNQYDAFGNLIDYSGTWNGPFSYGGAFGYQTDNDSGLMLLGHRYYDSSTGRFLSRDPIGDGINWYAYCLNNPIKFSDRSGLAPRPSYAPVEMVWVDHGVPGIGIQESSGWGALDIIHLVLDIAGTIDPTGICDGINAIVYVAEGDWFNASISAASMAPGGDVAKAGRLASTAGDKLYRYGRHRERASRLGRQAAEAEEKIGVHGVSVSTRKPDGKDFRSAPKGATERRFPVVKTGADPDHYTVELPKPVTPKVADAFNELFK